jgi:hypothetical protein
MTARSTCKQFVALARDHLMQPAGPNLPRPSAGIVEYSLSQSLTLLATAKVKF